MGVQFRTDLPLYPQIADWLKRGIVEGTYPPGKRLPSIRELALALCVTPNTLQRALSILEEEGLIRTERTSGKFVTGDGGRIRALRDELMTGRIRELVADLKRHGYGYEKINACLEREWKSNDE